MGKEMRKSKEVMNLRFKLLYTNYVVLNIKEIEIIDDLRIRINVVS